MEKQRNTILIVMEREWDLGIKSAEGLYRQKRVFFFLAGGVGEKNTVLTVLRKILW